MWKIGFKKFEADHITSNFLKDVFHKFYLVYSWMPWLNYDVQCYQENKEKLKDDIFKIYFLSDLIFYAWKWFANTGMSHEEVMPFTHILT